MGSSEIAVTPVVAEPTRTDLTKRCRTVSRPRRSVVELLRAVKRWVKGRTFDTLPPALLCRLVTWKMPRSAQIEVTTACNLRCPLCVTHTVERSTRFLDDSVVNDVLRGAGHRLKVVNFHILGEPLLHRGLFDFVRQCSRRGVRTTFSTNGMLLDRHVAEIVDSGLTHISIAVDGINDEDYARYRIGGDLDKVVRNVRALIEARRVAGVSHPVIQVQMVMFSYNEDKEAAVRAFLEEIGADVVSMKRPSYAAPPTNAAIEFLGHVDHANPERHFARPAIDSSRLYRKQRMCPQLERAAVLADGRVVSCCLDAAGDTEFGNVNKASFASIWRGAAHLEILKRFTRGELEPCEHCTLGDVDTAADAPRSA